jgi:hypothetical protein
VQLKGWATCPSKSLHARAIEESVLRRIQEANSGIADVADWERMDRTRQVAALHMIIDRVGYDGRSRQTSIRLREPEVGAEPEAEA